MRLNSPHSAIILYADLTDGPGVAGHAAEGTADNANKKTRVFLVRQKKELVCGIAKCCKDYFFRFEREAHNG